MDTPASSGKPPLPLARYARLSLMMFLQYAIWGAWLPLLWPFLHGHRALPADQIGNIFAVGAIGAIIAPFIAGQIADRWFATEKFLGISHIVGGLLVWQLAHLDSYWQFLTFSLLYSLVYSPTLPLTNSLTFHHIPDRDRDFGKVRLWGTIGWIVVGIGIGQWLFREHTPTDVQAALTAAELGTTAEQVIQAAQWAGMADAFRLSGVLGVLMGLYCFTLPHTPPSKGRENYATYEALREIAFKRRLLVLFLLAVPISCIHQFYFVHTAGFLGRYQTAAVAQRPGDQRQPGVIPPAPSTQDPGPGSESRRGDTQDSGPRSESRRGDTQDSGLRTQDSGPPPTLADRINQFFGVGGGGLMTLGQMAEILVLAAMPLLATRLTRKTLLGIGIVAYALRMALFAYVDPISSATGIAPVPILMAGVALHGLCFGCFIFVAFMVVDEETTPDVRASAQSLFNLVIIGIGIIVGSMFAARVAEWAAVPSALSPGPSEIDFTKLFSIPMWIALACLVALVALYPGGRRGEKKYARHGGSTPVAE